ncbi:MAG: Crp/Fnr family transcriptional regulator [Pseudomonadota bacterium]
MADATGERPARLDVTLDACASCAIRHSSLCGALSGEELRRLNAIATRTQLDVGEVHLFAGDDQHSFANVTGGVAKLVRGAEDGRAQIVGLLFPSDFIGGALGQDRAAPSPYAIEAVSEVALCTFPKAKFERVLHDHPTLEFKLLQRTMGELEIAREWMVLLGRKTAEERLATFLLYVAGKMRNVSCTGHTSFDLPLSRSDIADYIGLTLETVSRQMSKLKKAGIIRIEGTKHITFIDEDRLKARADF